MSRNTNPRSHPSLRDAVDVTRFWRNVDIQGPDECWIWTAYLDDNGYGLFQWHGRRVGAHELALSFSTGEVRTEGLDTRHSCDNPPCVNPAHLQFGTRRDNVQDMFQRGRAPRSGKLTDAQVLEIRERRAAGARQKDLAEQFGVSDGQISMIVRGRRWAHLGGPTESKQSQYKRGA